MVTAMSRPDDFRLYELLPAIYRIDDEKLGSPLRALFSVIEEQARALKQNIDQLYDDLFIETCAEWVVPYLGELVGNNPLSGLPRTRRADVARTLYYRRRKGTLTALEELARDVTGWSIRAVPFFELLAWNQNVNHVRQAGGTVNLRSLETMDLCGGPFETTAHGVDLREMGTRSGRYHPKRLGFFAWRLNTYHIDGSQALREAAPHQHGFHFHPLGLPTRLFQRPDDLSPGQPAAERHIRQPIHKGAFFADMSRFYDPSVTPAVHTHGPTGFGPQLAVEPMELSAFAQPTAGRVGVDVRRSLISFAAGEIPLEAGVSYEGTAPLLAERLPAPQNHLFRFAPLGLRIITGQGEIPLAQLQFLDLADWQQPATGVVGVDLGLGRIAFAPDKVPAGEVQVRYGQETPQPAVRAKAPHAHGYVIPLPANSRSLRITRDGAPVALFELCCMDLSDWDRPLSQRVGVDVALGRISFPAGEEPQSATVVSYDVGFSADLGGGTYDRSKAVAKQAGRDFPAIPAAGGERLSLQVGSGDFATIQSAIDAWENQNRPAALITITDNRTYVEDLVMTAGSGPLLLEAQNGRRPTIRGGLKIQGGNGAATVTLRGLWLQSAIRLAGNLARLEISHCSIAPGARPALKVDGTNVSIDVQVAHCITGAIELPPGARLAVSDSIVDCSTGAIEGSAVASLDRTTVLGPVALREVSLASECIFTDPVVVERRQAGCVRFSTLPASSQTPRRYRCQPDLALENVPPPERARVESRLTPVFTSRRWGDAGYAQLSLACANEVRTGGEDGCEMGAFQSLQQPRREANLLLRLDEYMPCDLRAGIIYEN
jgi:hypothetical protein